LRGEPRGTGGVFRGSTWVLAGKGVQMGLGFVFWVVAAREVELREVGVAAAGVSAVMLCTQLAILGTGSAVIVRLGRGADPKRTLDLALSLMGTASLVVAATYVAVTTAVGDEALLAGHAVLFVGIFVVSVLCGTATIFVDQASVALARAHGSTTRYAAGALAALGVLVTASLTAGLDALGLFACWTVGSVVVCLVGTMQLHAWIGYRFHPTLAFGETRGMLRIGVPNQLLTMTEKVSPALVPLILAHVASPDATARWYPVWMMAWVCFTAPLTASLLQFATSVSDDSRIRQSVWHALVWSLLAGAPLALGLAVLGVPLLSFMGEEYVGSGGALRILLLGLVPMTIIQAYNAVCRTLGRQTEAVGLGVLTTVAVGLTTAWSANDSVLQVAWLWLATMAVAAVVAAVRLLRLVPAASSRDLPPAVRVLRIAPEDVAHG
jgi:O-antigen/teichoic acid export membrane protein